MSEIIKKHSSWFLPIAAQLIIAGVIYMHTISVKAAMVEESTNLKSVIVSELKGYVTKDEVEFREHSHSQWSAEAMRRLDEKLDDVVKRLERIESRQNRSMK